MCVTLLHFFCSDDGDDMLVPSLTGEHCVVFTVIVVVLLLSLLHHFGMWHCFISHGLTLTLTQTTETWGSIGI